jgi:hypothetical protein
MTEQARAPSLSLGISFSTASAESVARVAAFVQAAKARAIIDGVIIDQAGATPGVKKRGRAVRWQLVGFRFATGRGQ